MNFLASRRASRKPSATSMISHISSKSGTTMAQGLGEIGGVGLRLLPSSSRHPMVGQLAAHLTCQAARSVRVSGPRGWAPSSPPPLPTSLVPPMPSALRPDCRQALHLFYGLFSEPCLPPKGTCPMPPRKAEREDRRLLLEGALPARPPTSPTGEPRVPGLPWLPACSGLASPLPTHLNKAFKFSGNSVRPA